MIIYQAPIDAIIAFYEAFDKGKEIILFHDGRGHNEYIEWLFGVDCKEGQTLPDLLFSYKHGVDARFPKCRKTHIEHKGYEVFIFDPERLEHTLNDLHKSRQNSTA